MYSQKFEFWNFDYIIKFAIKNESGIANMRSSDLKIFEENRFQNLKTLMHNNVNDYKR